MRVKLAAVRVGAGAMAMGLLWLGTTMPDASATPCPNEAIREGQVSQALPQGTIDLPACMALEMVSPPSKSEEGALEPSFSLDGNRVLFISRAALAQTPGLQSLADPYVAGRGPAGWSVAPTAPPSSAQIASGAEVEGRPYTFTPDLGRWVLLGSTQAQTSVGVGKVFQGGLDGSFSPLSPLLVPFDDSGSELLAFDLFGATPNGTASDLSTTVFQPRLASTAYLPTDPREGKTATDSGDTNSYVAFLDGGGEPSLQLLARDREGTVYGGYCGAAIGGSHGRLNQGAVSADGSRIFFSTRPAQLEDIPCMITGHAATTAGSNLLTSVIAAKGEGTLASGSSHVTGVTTSEGAFVVGQTVIGVGIPAGTTITAVGSGSLDLSVAATASGARALAAGALPFAVGQAITGSGIPAGATVTAVNGQTATLSVNATASLNGDLVQAMNPLRIFKRVETLTGPLISEIAPGGPATGSDLYQGASVDGTRVYFTSPRVLSSSDHDPSSEECGPKLGGSVGCDLYLYDGEKPPSERLTDVSAGGAGDPTPGEGADVLSSITAISGDGSHAYFVAQGILTTDPNPEGATAVAGQPNLYVYNDETGHVAFIGTVDPSDDAEPSHSRLWGGGVSFNGGAYAVPLLGDDGGGGSGSAGDGHILVFASRAPLTAGDSDGGHSDVFRYDSDKGTLVRLSSAAPGGSDNGPFDVSVNPNSRAPEANFAEQGRWVSEDGSTVAFATAEPLSPGDEGEALSPYIWKAGELATVGAETGEPPTVSPGGEEFAFSTPQPLLAADGDTAEDVYVARVDGGFPNPSPPAPPCAQEACQGSPAAPPSPVGGGSRDFSGPGNVRKRFRCPKKFARRNGRCVKRHHHRRRHGKRRAASQGGRK